ncbi:hypothetical protein KR054_004973, partial [Drosophila jambulina]
MPRGKYVNHKGRCRQFTPSDQLQQELGMIMDKDKVQQNLAQGNGEPNKKFDQTEYDEEYPLDKHSTRGIHNLIEVSNPNRLPHDASIVGQKDKARDERMRQKQGQPNSQAQADLERLFIVRKEREAAAQRRLAAKKAAAEADASRLVS